MALTDQIFVKIHQSNIEGEPVDSVTVEPLPDGATCVRHLEDEGMDDVLAVWDVVSQNKGWRFHRYLCEQCYLDYWRWSDKHKPKV